jgi:hypothetical protein
MSKKSTPPADPPKHDYRVHPEKSLKGHPYKFHEKHRNCTRNDHGCWRKEYTRPMEFALFQDAETQEFSDEDENLYNVHKDGNEYIELGTRQELMAFFWNPHSNAEWHGFPTWPIKTREDYNRKGERYRPSKIVMQKFVDKGRMSERDADRIRRGDYP